MEKSDINNEGKLKLMIAATKQRLHDFNRPYTVYNTLKELTLASVKGRLGCEE